MISDLIFLKSIYKWYKASKKTSAGFIPFQKVTLHYLLRYINAVENNKALRYAVL